MNISIPKKPGRPLKLGKRRYCICGQMKDPYARWCLSCFKAKRRDPKTKKDELFVKKKDFYDDNGSGIYC